MPAFDARAFDEVAYDVDFSELPILIGSIGDIIRTWGRPDQSYKVLIDSLKVSDVADEVPNRATFTAMGFVPLVGDRVVFALGSLSNSDRLFAGSILRVDNGYVTSDPRHQTYAASCIDDTWRLNTKKVIGHYTGSATDIVLALVAAYVPWVTTAHVAAGLPILEGGITFTNQDVTDALTQITKRIGAYWKLDYFGDLHVFFTDASGAPLPLTNTHPTLRDVVVTRDVSQVVTRVFVEGGGGVALAEVPIGETILPVSDASWYTDTGGVVVTGPQRVRYTGLEVGGGGSLVGTGAAPAAAPNGTLADGAGIEDGVHKWAYTYVTAAGESVPSPLLALDVGTVPAPTIAPVAGAPISGTGVTTGAHSYAVTFKTAIGQTPASPLSNSVTTGPSTTGLIAAPGNAPSGTVSTTTGNLYTGPFGQYRYGVTYTNAGGETTEGPTLTKNIPAVSISGLVGTGAATAGGSVDLGTHTWEFTALTSTGETPWQSAATFAIVTAGVQTVPISIPAASALDPRVTHIGIYRSKVSGGAGTYRVALVAVTAAAQIYNDVAADASLSGPAPPLTDTASTGSIALTSIPLGPPGTTGRKVYRTVVDGVQLKLLTTLSNNTATTYTDNTADAGLGVNVPTVNTTATTTNFNVVPVTLPVGPANATHVYLYRTAAGGAQLKFVAAIVNGITSYNDSMTDAALGVNVPVTNTADANRVALTGIGIGPSGVTDRKLYRTIAAGSQLKLVTTIAGNLATTYTDSAADAALTTNAPIADTSGLDQPRGQVLAGATTIPVANTIDFPTTGWALVSGDQAIRYTGKTANSLTGVTGIGATIGYNSTIKAAPQLTGISATPPGAILYTIPKGQDVNLLVQVDDAGAQATLGDLLRDLDGNPTDGIQEAYVQDRRLSDAEALARGQAYLELYSAIETTIRYTCQDPMSKAGLDITVALTDPMPVTGVFKIQTVNISFTTSDLIFPWYDVVASSTRFSFEDLLRQTRPA